MSNDKVYIFMIKEQKPTVLPYYKFYFYPIDHKYTTNKYRTVLQY